MFSNYYKISRIYQSQDTFKKVQIIVISVIPNLFRDLNKLYVRSWNKFRM